MFLLGKSSSNIMSSRRKRSAWSYSYDVYLTKLLEAAKQVSRPTITTDSETESENDFVPSGITGVDRDYHFSFSGSTKRSGTVKIESQELYPLEYHEPDSVIFDSTEEKTVNDKLHLPFANDHKEKSGVENSIGMDKIDAQDNKSWQKRERSTFQIQSGVTKNLEGLNKSALTEMQDHKEMATWFNMAKMRRIFSRWKSSAKIKSKDTDSTNDKDRLGVSLKVDFLGKKERMNRTGLLYEKILRLEAERDLKVMEARQAEEMLHILRKKFHESWTPAIGKNSSPCENEVSPPGYTAERIANSLEVNGEINIPWPSENTSSEPQVETFALSQNSKGKMHSDITNMDCGGWASDSFKKENLPVMGVPFLTLTKSDEFNSLSSLNRNQRLTLVESPTFLDSWTEYQLSPTTTYPSQEGNLQHSLRNTSEREKALKAPAQETLPGWSRWALGDPKYKGYLQAGKSANIFTNTEGNSGKWFYVCLYNLLCSTQPKSTNRVGPKNNLENRLTTSIFLFSNENNWKKFAAETAGMDVQSKEFGIQFSQFSLGKFFLSHESVVLHTRKNATRKAQKNKKTVAPHLAPMECTKAQREFFIVPKTSSFENSYKFCANSKEDKEKWIFQIEKQLSKERLRRDQLMSKKGSKKGIVVQKKKKSNVAKDRTPERSKTTSVGKTGHPPCLVKTQEDFSHCSIRDQNSNEVKGEKKRRNMRSSGSDRNLITYSSSKYQHGIKVSKRKASMLERKKRRAYSLNVGTTRILRDQQQVKTQHETRNMLKTVNQRMLIRAEWL